MGQANSTLQPTSPPLRVGLAVELCVSRIGDYCSCNSPRHCLKRSLTAPPVLHVKPQRILSVSRLHVAPGGAQHGTRDIETPLQVDFS